MNSNAEPIEFEAYDAHYKRIKDSHSIGDMKYMHVLDPYSATLELIKLHGKGCIKTGIPPLERDNWYRYQGNGTWYNLTEELQQARALIDALNIEF